MSVNANDNTTEAGDEPVMIAAATDCPVVVDPDRNLLHYNICCQQMN
ncbi:MAG: hypothetical protein CM1200mP40_33980 [Gammaproteobacteria bacterium]|nr:MAG: hypothetical protein CM1200mP40_33980 [Gammaproteobacteria bacterium]